MLVEVGGALNESGVKFLMERFCQRKHNDRGEVPDFEVIKYVITAVARTSNDTLTIWKKNGLYVVLYKTWYNHYIQRLKEDSGDDEAIVVVSGLLELVELLPFTNESHLEISRRWGVDLLGNTMAAKYLGGEKNIKRVEKVAQTALQHLRRFDDLPAHEGNIVLFQSGKAGLQLEAFRGNSEGVGGESSSESEDEEVCGFAIDI